MTVDGTHEKTGSLMPACTQPKCIGTIVDGYCDVCGSPADAVPFAPIAASATSAAAADEAGLMATQRGPGFPAKPGSGNLTTACTQPGCTGMIFDGYCDVCGSPADAVPFVPAAPAASPAPADEAGLTAIQRGPVFPLKPRSGNLTTACTQPGCTGTILDGYCNVCGSPAGAVPLVQSATLAAATPSAADDSGRFEEVAQGRPNPAAQEYRTRVEQANLPDDVRVAALREVDKLERTIAQSTECRDIRIWLDTILELPWGTKTTDWSDDIQGSRELEATLQGLIKPTAAKVEEPDTAEVESAVEVDTEEPDTVDLERAVAEVDTEEPDTVDLVPAVAEADTEEADAAEVEPAAAEVEEDDAAEGEPAVAEVEEADTAEVEPAEAEDEKPNRASAGPRNSDTVETHAVLAVPSAAPQPGPQLPEQEVVEPVPAQAPAEKRRRSVPLALVAAALVAVLIGAFFVATRDGNVTSPSIPTATATSIPTATATVSTPTNEPSDDPTSTGPQGSPIQLQRLPAPAGPFQAVPIRGTYRGGAEILLRVQREEEGVWVDFPTPSVTDASGKFSTYVELGQPGRYRLRVLDPASGITSATFVLLIKG
jgi:hypothetical protein